MGCNQSQVQCPTSVDKRTLKLDQVVIENLQGENSPLVRVENRKLSKVRKSQNAQLQHQKLQQEANIKRLKYLKQSKMFVEMSIQTNICIDKLLQALAANNVLQNNDYKKLASINEKSLIKKQNRYKNLQKRQQKAENKAVSDYNKGLKRQQENKSMIKLVRGNSNKENFLLGQCDQQETLGINMKRKFTEKINKFKDQINSNKILLQR